MVHTFALLFSSLANILWQFWKLTIFAQDLNIVNKQTCLDLDLSQTCFIKNCDLSYSLNLYLSYIMLCSNVHSIIQKITVYECSISVYLSLSIVIDMDIIWLTL